MYSGIILEGFWGINVFFPPPFYLLNLGNSGSLTFCLNMLLSLLSILLIFGIFEFLFNIAFKKKLEIGSCYFRQTKILFCLLLRSLIMQCTRLNTIRKMSRMEWIQVKFWGRHFLRKKHSDIIQVFWLK